MTINGEARPIVWVELQHVKGGQHYGTTTISGGAWEFDRIPPYAEFVVMIKTPPGLTCDATQKPATVEPDQRTVVNFACVGDVRSSIQGFATNEFGTAPSAFLTLTGPVNREAISNRDGFFAFEDLPDGEYLLEWCKPAITVSVRKGVPAYATVDCS